MNVIFSLTVCLMVALSNGDESNTQQTSSSSASSSNHYYHTGAAAEPIILSGRSVYINGVAQSEPSVRFVGAGGTSAMVRSTGGTYYADTSLGLATDPLLNEALQISQYGAAGIQGLGDILAGVQGRIVQTVSGQTSSSNDDDSSSNVRTVSHAVSRPEPVITRAEPEKVYRTYSEPIPKQIIYRTYSEPRQQKTFYNAYYKPQPEKKIYKTFSEPQPEKTFYNGYYKPQPEKKIYNGYYKPQPEKKIYNGYYKPQPEKTFYRSYFKPQPEKKIYRSYSEPRQKSTYYSRRLPSLTLQTRAYVPHMARRITAFGAFHKNPVASLSGY